MEQKTEGIIFKRRRKPSQEEKKFYFKEEMLMVVVDAKYLGFICNSMKAGKDTFGLQQPEGEIPAEFFQEKSLASNLEVP